MKKSKRIKRAALAFIMIVSAAAFAGCGGGSDGGGHEATLPDGYEPGTEKILTVVTADGEKTEFSEADLADIDLVEYEYSGRNKEQNNERQTREYMGVLLEDLFSKVRSIKR